MQRTIENQFIRKFIHSFSELDLYLIRVIWERQPELLHLTTPKKVTPSTSIGDFDDPTDRVLPFSLCESTYVTPKEGE